jgi:hypothetical protein
MGWEFKAHGLAETINFLEKFNTDVAKILKKEMKDGANEVAKVSRSLIPTTPLTNWGAWTYSKDGRDFSFDSAKVKRLITAKQKRQRISVETVGFGYVVENKSIAGAVYELAGSRDRSGESFNSQINMLNGSIKPNRPRTLIPAYYQAMPTAIKKIEAALDKASKSAGG